MSGLFISFFIFALIAVIIEQILPDNKVSALIKPVIFCSVIICFLSTLKNFNYKTGSDDLVYSKYDNTETVWKLAEQNCEKAIEENMKELCKNNQLYIDRISVDVTTDFKSYEIEKVEIYGLDCKNAKNLISSYYLIKKDHIYIGGEIK